eukprot:125863_1
MWKRSEHFEQDQIELSREMLEMQTGHSYLPRFNLYVRISDRLIDSMLHNNSSSSELSDSDSLSHDLDSTWNLCCEFGFFSGVKQLGAIFLSTISCLCIACW